MRKIFFLFLYIIISVVFTYPLILNLSGSLVGWPLDGYLYLWNIDTFWHQIFNFQNPFITQRIFFPIGANLSLNSSAPLVSLLGLPFLKNEIPFLNILIILSLPLSAFFSYLFIKKITKNDLGGFIGGLFYGFNPVMFSFLISQHYYFAFAALFLPLCLFQIHQFVKNRKIINLAIVVLLFWMTFFTDYYTGILFVILSIVYFVSLLLNKEGANNILLSKKALLTYLTTILIGVILPLFLFIKFVFNFNDLKNFVSYENGYPINCSAKLKEFLIPSQLNPTFGKISDNLRIKWDTPLERDTPFYFLGWGTLIFTLSTIFLLPKKNTFPFLVFGVCIFVFTLGPKTQIFNAFTKLPFMGLIDCPQRFTLGIYLALSTIIGILASYMFSTRTGYKKYFLTIFFVLIFLMDYGSFGLPISKIETPQVYKELSTIKDQRTLLEIPSGLTESKKTFGYDWSIYGLNSMQMYWQTIYNKNRVGGYVSRIGSDTYKYFEEEPIISDIFILSSPDGKWDGNNFTKEEVTQVMRDLDLGFIILSPNDRQAIFESVIDKVFKNFIERKTKYEDKFILYVLKKP